ncbi:MAG: cytidine deaminase [Bacteroidota bacterium]
MRTFTQSIEYQVFTSATELAPSDRELLDKAREAVATSHAPYSRYHVGAAVRLANGFIVTGSNQENMSFPAGLCAERVAVFAAVSNHPGIPIASIAITAMADAFEVNRPVPPCGMCRQAIVEFEMKYGNKIRLILGGQSGEVYVVQGMETLLPMTFHEDGLAKT